MVEEIIEDVVQNEEIGVVGNTTPKPLTRKQTVQRIFESHFGEDRVELITYPSGDHTIIVYFPEVVVENSNGGKHLIKDTFIKLEFYSNFRLSLPRGFKIKRTTFYLSEALCGYVFSHAPRASHFIPREADVWAPEATKWRDPCMGQGPIRDTTEMCKSKYSLEYLRLLCLELDTYIRWESLEGGPYIRMSSITSSFMESVGSLRSPALSLIIGILLPKFIESDRLNISTTVNNLGVCNFEISNSQEEIQSIIYKLAQENLSPEQLKVIECYYDPINKVCKQPKAALWDASLNREEDLVIPTSTFHFKGRQFPCIVLQEDLERFLSIEIQSYKKVIHTDIQTYIIQIVNESINSYYNPCYKAEVAPPIEPY